MGVVKTIYRAVNAFFGRTVTLGTLWGVTFVSFIVGIGLILLGWREREQLDVIFTATANLILISGLFTMASLAERAVVWAGMKLFGKRGG
jgi:hypothetical protein